MDHNDAVASNATERYLLDELPPDQRDAFEAHYFDCSECAADVRAGAQMIAALGEKKDGEVVDIRRHPKWARWMPQAAAASVICASLGWYGGMQHAIRGVAATSQPRITEIVQVELREAERGPGDVEVIPAGAYASLNVEIPHAEAAESYAYAVVDGAGKSWFSGSKSREQAAAEAVSLLLPALPRGSYRVVIEGVRKDGNRFPVSSMNFRVGETER